MLMMQAVMPWAVRLPDSLRFTCAPDEGVRRAFDDGGLLLSRPLRGPLTEAMWEWLARGYCALRHATALRRFGSELQDSVCQQLLWAISEPVPEMMALLVL